MFPRGACLQIHPRSKTEVYEKDSRGGRQDTRCPQGGLIAQRRDTTGMYSRKGKGGLRAGDMQDIHDARVIWTRSGVVNVGEMR